MPLDEARIRAHALRPAQVRGVVSSRGLQDIALAPLLGTDWLVDDDLYHFDVDTFRSELQTALAGVSGYVVGLHRHGRPLLQLEVDWAKRPGNGDQAWSSSVKMHVASLSKLVTAIAVTRLLRDHGIDVDTPVSAFLPTTWSQGPHVAEITFRHLLTHRSGFSTGGSGSDYALMRQQVADGVSAVGGYDYENLNFGLCRILLATVSGAVPTSQVFTLAGTTAFNDVIWDLVTIEAYSTYVRDVVLTPAGVVGATLTHEPAHALAYRQPLNQAGWDSGDLTTMSGGAGWHLSVDDVLAVLGTLRRSGMILTLDQAQAMLDDSLGIDEIVSSRLGLTYRKDGRWTSSEGHTEQSVLVVLPRDMELVVFVNSPVGAPAMNLSRLVMRAYTAAVQSGRSVRGYFLRTDRPVTSSVRSSAAPGDSVRQLLRS